jgi:hypothetical protein
VLGEYSLEHVFPGLACREDCGAWEFQGRVVGFLGQLYHEVHEEHKEYLVDNSRV